VDNLFETGGVKGVVDEPQVVPLALEAFDGGLD